MEFEEQIKKIATLLKEKGYPEIFHFNGNWNWPVEKGFSLYRNDETHERYSRYHARMRLRADIYRHSHKGSIGIAFNVGYDEKRGFTMLCMEIPRQRPEGKITFPDELFLESWDMIPSVSQVKEMMGVDINSQVKELVDNLQRKGYKKDFMIGDRPAAPLQAGLVGYISNCKGSLEESKLFPIQLRTHTHYRGDRDRVECSFKTDYTEFGGFRLESMAISRYRGYCKEPSKRYLVPLVWERVPTAEKINQRYRLGVHQKGL